MKPSLVLLVPILWRAFSLVLILAAVLLCLVAWLRAEDKIQQTTSGDNSPAVIAEGDVSITAGKPADLTTEQKLEAARAQSDLNAASATYLDATNRISQLRQQVEAADAKYRALLEKFRKEKGADAACILNDKQAWVNCPKSEK
jgi:hypothetical protein